ncbi:MAG TPA: methyltransferase domain-containing protein [Gaiellaceae bacterium]|jgi:magnesium-protoporphyrin O-methyltransferase|nr:methyltransferase domain-containing protein [Gaiellaceae bacterium]
MSGCCTPGAYGKVFGKKQARKYLRKYRKQGLPADARFGIDFLAGRGITGGTVLEVGGGIGAVQVELVEHGADHVCGVELSPEYEEAAAALREEKGVSEERVERRIGDFVTNADSLSDADAVVLFRVVCCYPDYPGLLEAAAAKARRFLVVSFPPDGWAAGAFVALMNVFLRLSRSEFRIYAHSHAGMIAVAERHGFHPVARQRSGLWSTVALAMG